MGFRLQELFVPGEDEDGQPVDVKTSAVDWLGESGITAEQLVKGRGRGGDRSWPRRRGCSGGSLLAGRAGGHGDHGR